MLTPLICGRKACDRLANRPGNEVAKSNKIRNGKKMHTSRTALNRLLDASDTSLTLTTLSSAASVLGKKLRIELEAA